MTERDGSAVYFAETTETEICAGKFQLVYMSPESLLTNATWRDMLQSDVYRTNLVEFVVDEAHCVNSFNAGCIYICTRAVRLPPSPRDAYICIANLVRVGALPVHRPSSLGFLVSHWLCRDCPSLH